jgi:hypothetical protein
MTHVMTNRRTLTDKQALRRLAEHHGSVAKAATAIGISENRLRNWQVRGISNEGRPHVWRALKAIGIKLPLEWALAKEHDYSNFGTGEADGRASKSKAKRGRAQQRKHRARRGLSALDEKDRGGAGRRRARGQAAQVAQV